MGVPCRNLLSDTQSKVACVKNFRPKVRIGYEDQTNGELRVGSVVINNRLKPPFM
jgi:hypothetical protein